MFLPQVTTAIAASLLGAGLARRISTKRAYLLGLVFSLLSMGLLITSTFVRTDQSVAYPLLLIASAFLGAGFGLTVPVLNTYSAVFHPASVDRSVLILNAPARARYRACAGVRGRVRRPWVLVGPSSPVRGDARGAVDRQPAAAPAESLQQAP